MILLGMSGGIQLLMIGITLLFPLLALIDILTHEITGSNKLIWAFAVIFVPLFGAILYYLIGTRQKVRR
jgi:hypothetical protein